VFSDVQKRRNPPSAKAVLHSLSRALTSLPSHVPK